VKGKIGAFVEDSKDIRRISATLLENQIRNSWEDLRRILSDYQNSKQIFVIFIMNVINEYIHFYTLYLYFH